MDYQALKTEIQTDPAELGYANKTPDQIAALLASTTVQAECFVPLRDLQSLLMETIVPPATWPAWWVLENAAGSNPLAKMAFDLFSSRLENLNTRGAFQSGALAQLQQAGLIDAALRAKIDALSFASVPRGKHLFGRTPSVLDVTFAMMME